LVTSLKIADSLTTKIVPSTKPNSSGSSTLEVKPAIDNAAKPLDFNLQGSSPEGQKAVGELQKPSKQELQPNAKKGIFSESF
jgi:hypothetical protein